MSGKIRIITLNKGRIYILGFLLVIILTSILSCAVLLSTAQTHPHKNRSIIIDPGHGGIDGGTTDYVSFFEKDINLKISQKLKKLLCDAGINTDLTRESDISLDNLNNASPSRHERDLIARVTMFNSGKYDFFVSIHVNSSPNPDTCGQLVFYSYKIPEAYKLALCIQNRLNLHMKNYLGKEIKRQPQESNLFIFRNSNIPGVLVETGFITNKEEKALLQTEEYQQKIAEAIFKGIKDYYEK